MVLDPAQLMFWFVIGLLDRFAAFDFTVSSPLSVASLNQACITSGFAALSAETRKHKANDPKCSEIGWVCVPLAVENWGKEARDTFSRLAPGLPLGLPDQRVAVCTKYTASLI